MRAFVHARKTKENELKFRVWSADSYVSKEMTEWELREWLLKDAVCDAIEDHNRSVDARIERTIKNGTSSQMGDKRKLSGPWDKEKK